VTSRLIDPVKHIERAAAADHGVTTTGEMMHRQVHIEKLSAEPIRNQNFIIQETINFYMYNVVANATTSMFLFMAAGLSAFTLVNILPPVGGQCRLLTARVMASENVTAGTITPQLSVFDDGVFTDYDFDVLQLGAGEFTASARWDWDNAPVQLSAAAQPRFALVASAAYAPTTADYWMACTFGYGQWGE
jgi:hypothetical protein